MSSLVPNSFISRPPKNSGKRKAAFTAASDGTATPHIPTLAERLSYLHSPRPFKNPNYFKNVNRRMKNLKTILSQERERERLEREKRRQEKLGSMDVDGQVKHQHISEDDIPSYTSIEAPPSVLPPRHYCDITGLEGPYTDPATRLRYHDKNVYEQIKALPASAAKDYLAARGVNPIVK